MQNVGLDILCTISVQWPVRLRHLQRLARTNMWSIHEDICGRESPSRGLQADTIPLIELPVQHPRNLSNVGENSIAGPECETRKVDGSGIVVDCGINNDTIPPPTIVDVNTFLKCIPCSSVHRG